MSLYTQLNFTDNEYLDVPALDIEEMFSSESLSDHENTQLNEYSILKGRRFLDLAARGKRLISQAMSNNVFVGDSKAINAWDVTEEALNKIQESHEDLSADIIFIRIQSLFEALDDKTMNPAQIEAQDREYVRKLFRYISEIPAVSDDLP